MIFDTITSGMHEKSPLRSCQEVWLMENAHSHMHVKVFFTITKALQECMCVCFMHCMLIFHVGL